jgi:hypothetical protein
MSPNLHIHVSVSDLHIPTIGFSEDPIMGIYNLVTDT